MSINFDFDICPQARAVQAALAFHQDQPAFEGLDVQAWPLFNGRERGVCLVIGYPDPWDNLLLVSFGENRKSDHIFVQSTTSDRVMMNGPRVSDFSETDYQNRVLYDPLHIHSAVARIVELVETWKASIKL